MSQSQVARLEELITAIYSAQDPAALKAAVAKAFQSFGFDNFTMGVNARDKHEVTLSPLVTSFPDHFQRKYEEFNLPAWDPVLARNVASPKPFYWHTAWAYRGVNEKRIIDLMHSMPATCGVAIRLPSVPGRISTACVATIGDANPGEDTIYGVSIVARIAMMRAECLGLCTTPAHARVVDADLSPRQIEVLSWAAQGKSNSDIAIITGQSKRSVDYHISEILRKLKVATRAQAIALATRIEEK